MSSIKVTFSFTAFSSNVNAKKCNYIKDPDLDYLRSKLKLNIKAKLLLFDPISKIENNI